MKRTFASYYNLHRHSIFSQTVIGQVGQLETFLNTFSEPGEFYEIRPTDVRYNGRRMIVIKRTDSSGKSKDFPAALWFKRSHEGYCDAVIGLTEQKVVCDISEGYDNTYAMAALQQTIRLHAPVERLGILNAWDRAEGRPQTKPEPSFVDTLVNTLMGRKQISARPRMA